jgi:hypothetical protein
MYFYISIIITCKIYEEWNNDTFNYCNNRLQYAQLTQSYSTEEDCNGEMKIKLGRTLGKHVTILSGTEIWQFEKSHLGCGLSK